MYEEINIRDKRFAETPEIGSYGDFGALGSMIERRHRYSLDHVQRFWEFTMDPATGGSHILQDVSIHTQDILGLIEGKRVVEDDARILMQVMGNFTNLKTLYLILSYECRSLSLLPLTEGSWYFVLGGVLQQTTDGPGLKEIHPEILIAGWLKAVLSQQALHLTVKIVQWAKS